MNNPPSLGEINKTANMDPNLLTRHYKIELSVENKPLKNQKGQYDEKWLQESKLKLLKEIDDEKRANLIMSRTKKQMNIHQ